MSAVCANFFSRTEVQGLAVRANHLTPQVDGELRDACVNLAAAAARLDGVMADLTGSNHPSDKALRNPNGWESVWLDGSFCAGPMKIVYGQQALKVPSHPTSYVMTGRYKLVLGRGGESSTHVSSDRRKLRNILVSYVLSLPEDVPADAKECILSRLFMEDADAVQVEGSTEIHVRQSP